jgi:hypothetical protein
MAEALSAELDAALDGTGWCAGWVVNVEDVMFRASDVGSNRGTGTAAHTCGRWVEITVEAVYTSESSEADDTAGLRVDASDHQLEVDLRAHPSLLAGTGHESLLGDAGDDAVANAVAGLPAAMAELDLVTPVAAAPATDGEPGVFELPDAEGEGGSGSDTWAQHPAELIAGGVFLALAGAALIAMLVAHGLGRSGALVRPSLAGATRRWPGSPTAPASGAPPYPATVNPRRALRQAQLSADAPSRS